MATSNGRSGPYARPGAACAVGWVGGEYLGHVGVDGLLAGRGGDGYPVVAVAHEMQAPDAVHLDRRDRRTAPLCQRQLLPAFPHPAGGGPEVPVEVQLPLAAPPERAGDLGERQEAAAVSGLAAQAAGERGQDLAAPGPLEVVLGVCAGESG